MMRRVFALALLATSAAAFHAPAAGFLRQRPRAAASPRLRQTPVSPVCLAAAGGDDPEVVFDANAGWQADHNKAAAAMASGGHQQLKIKEQGTNQDTPDYFETEDGSIVGSTNALDANINTRNQVQEDLEKKAASKDSGNQNVLQELLSSDNAMVKEFDRQTYTTTLQRMGGFVAHKWKIDGDWNTEPETFGLTFNTVAKTQSQLFLQPNAMTFEDFLAGWTDDTPEGFQVTPTKGTMDRRGGEETPFTITYTGSQPTEPLVATLVVLLPNDNFQWTFKFQVSPP